MNITAIEEAAARPVVVSREIDLYALTETEGGKNLCIDFNYYRDFTDATAKYPTIVGPEYAVIGLGNEVGELAEAVIDLNGSDSGAASLEGMKRVFKEIGDIHWYVARCCVHAAYDYNHLVAESLQLIRDEQLGMVGIFAPSQYTLLMAKHAGLALGHHKKLMRDIDLWDDTKKQRNHAAFLEQLRWLIAWTVLFCASTGSFAGRGHRSFADILAGNMAKLTDRAARGVIQGDGDNR